MSRLSYTDDECRRGRFGTNTSRSPFLRFCSATRKQSQEVIPSMRCHDFRCHIIGTDTSLACATCWRLMTMSHCVVATFAQGSWLSGAFLSPMRRRHDVLASRGLLYALAIARHRCLKMQAVGHGRRRHIETHTSLQRPPRHRERPYMQTCCGGDIRGDFSCERLLMPPPLPQMLGCSRRRNRVLLAETCHACASRRGLLLRAFVIRFPC